MPYLCIVIQKALKNHFPNWKNIFSNWEAEFKPKFVKPDSKPCNESFESLTGKSSARDEAKRGQNTYEPKHESIHQVSHRGRVLCRRHIPLQLVYCGARDRKEPATTSGEQHLHPGRFFPFRSDHYHPVKAAKGNQPIYFNQSYQIQSRLQTSKRVLLPTLYPPKIPDFLRKRNARKVLTGGKEEKQIFGKTGTPERFPEGRSLQEVLSLWLST